MKALAIAAALLVIGAGAAPAAAQARIAGAVSDESGAPAAYALVALVQADDSTREHGHVLTDDDGRYAFASAPAGRYRLHVSRIGYERHTTDAFDVAPDARLTRDVAVRTEPVVLHALVVTEADGCFPLDQLADAAPDVAALWQEAVKGIEIEQAFLRGYGRTVDMRMETRQDNRLIRDVHNVETRTIVFPDSAVVDSADSAMARDDRYGASESTSLTLSLPSERVVTDPEMLRGYCIEEQVSSSGDGALGLHFRPVDFDQPGIVVEGAVFIEEDDYRLRGLSFHYFMDREFVGTGEWIYGNVRVPGDVLRLPVSGSLRMMHIPAPMGLLIREFDMQVTYSDYRDFEPLP